LSDRDNNQAISGWSAVTDATLRPLFAAPIARAAERP
jgi:hypothetical protein